MDEKINVEEYFLLKMASYKEKVKFGVSMMNLHQKVEFAYNCVNLVLPIFEKKYPDEKRPEKVMTSIEKWLIDKEQIDIHALDRDVQKACTRIPPLYEDQTSWLIGKTLSLCLRTIGVDEKLKYYDRMVHSWTESKDGKMDSDYYARETAYYSAYAALSFTEDSTPDGM